MKLSAFELILLEICIGVASEDSDALPFKSYLDQVKDKVMENIMSSSEQELVIAATKFKTIDPDFAKQCDLMIAAAKFRRQMKDLTKV